MLSPIEGFAKPRRWPKAVGILLLFALTFCAGYMYRVWTTPKVYCLCMFPKDTSRPPSLDRI